MKKAILTNHSTDANELNMSIVASLFQDTRKHKRYRKIVADSFIAQSNNDGVNTYTLVNVKNSKIEVKTKILEGQAVEIIEALSLSSRADRTFKKSQTWRTDKGWLVVTELLGARV